MGDLIFLQNAKILQSNNGTNNGTNNGYLKYDIHIKNHILQLIEQDETSKNKFKIGIVWKTFACDSERRCINPSILIQGVYDAFTDYGQKPQDAPAIFDLQYGGPNYKEYEQDLTSAINKTKIPIIRISNIDNWNDMDKFFPLVASMDMVIGIGNATTHISGSLGVDTMVLVPFSPSWRWCQTDENNKSIWYKNATIIRQREYDNWDTVMKKLHFEIQNNLENLKKG